MASKIIVYGDVNGKFQAAFAKLANLHAKNSFALALIAGNLFAEADDDAVTSLLSGDIIVPLPTYFSVGTTGLPPRVQERIEKDEEICPNLHYLPKRSTTKTAEGIRIVTLGGTLDETVTGKPNEQYLPYHTLGDAKVLHGANSADILLTTSWPAGIRTGSKVPEPEGVKAPEGQQYISDLCTALKPRYHLSTSSNFFFEREAFFHTPSPDSPEYRPVTRFVSLAAQGNENKQRAMYAFALPPLDQTAPLPVGATVSPFNPGGLTSRKRGALDPDPYPRGPRNGGNGHYRDKYSRGRGGRRQPPPGPDQCFFCLANETVSLNLVSHIGDNSYLTVAKGPLTTETTYANAGINFPAHILIIPIPHSPTISLIRDSEKPEAKTDTFAEMLRFKTALQSCIGKMSNNTLGSVTYEISKADGVHTHWQFLPLPAKLIRDGLVEAAFRVEAENHSYPSFETRDPGLGDKDGDFFRVWIWTPPSALDSSDGSDEGTTKCLTLPFTSDVRFNLQFGRTVLAKLLGLEKRIQWRECAQTTQEEERDVEAFKVAFKEFDFTT